MVHRIRRSATDVDKRFVDVYNVFMRVCNDCGENKSLDQFYDRKDRRIDRRCKVCHREYRKRHYRNNKEYYLSKARKSDLIRTSLNIEIIKSYLVEHPCIDCGNSDLDVLTFDHRDPSDKVDNVSNMLKWSSDKLVNEISKCDVRCSNCHLKKSRRQFGWKTYYTT